MSPRFIIWIDLIILFINTRVFIVSHLKPYLFRLETRIGTSYSF